MLSGTRPFECPVALAVALIHVVAGRTAATAFTTFVDAFGGNVGAAAHTHRYAAPGTYQVTFTVTDDDGGVGSGSANLRVVDAVGAVQEILVMVDASIAAASTRGQRVTILGGSKRMAAGTACPLNQASTASPMRGSAS